MVIVVLGFGAYPSRGNPFMEATGGTITTVGDFKVHTFNSSGTFTVANEGATGTVDFLVIAGGGGGGGEKAGGGGAGGYRNSFASESSGGGGSSESVLTVSEQAYTITVGAGGAGEFFDADDGVNGQNDGDGTQGGNSSIATNIVSIGGGCGNRELLMERITMEALALVH